MTLLTLLPLVAPAQKPTLPAPLRRSFAVLKKAKSLSIVGTLQTVGAPAAPITIHLSRPDRFLVRTARSITVCDGATFTHYDKASNSYTQEPKPEFMPDEFFGRPEVVAWEAFFAKDPGWGIRRVAASPAARVGGHATDGVVFDTGVVGSTTSLLIDRKLGVPRRAVVNRAGETTVVEAKTIQLGIAPLPASLFRFSPPSGAKRRETPHDP